MLPADTDLQIGLGLPTSLDPHFHKLSHPGLVQAREGIRAHYLGILVIRQEGTGIIAAETETSLGQIVRSKTEECRMLGHIDSRKCRPGISIMVPTWYFS